MTNEILKRILSSIILLILTFFCINKGSYYFITLLIAIFVISSSEWHYMSKNKSYYLYGFIYLIISIFFVFKIRYDFTSDASLFLLITIICILTDVGGFIFGKVFKGLKLTKYSPNKTYSGLFGSFFLSLSIIPINYYFSFLNDISLITLLIFTLIVSGASQFGDIFISYCKRFANIIDTGNIIRGQGGVLDRIDGMIFAFPIAYLMILFNFIEIVK